MPNDNANPPIEPEVIDDHTSMQMYQGPGVLQQLTKGEIDQQIATAHSYPRVISRFRDRLHELVTLDQRTADECIYALPRGGKTIEGPSIRFAEMAATAWGNLRIACTIMDVGTNAVIVRGVAHDLESNVAVAVEVRRVVQKKRSKAVADDDDKQLAVAAATAIARRNAILAVIPKSLCAAAYEAAGVAASGKGTMEHRRLGALQEYQRRHSVQAGTVLAALGRESVEDLTETDLRHLRGLLNAIKQGEITVEDAMRPKAEREAAERPRAAGTPSDIAGPRAATPKAEPTPAPSTVPTTKAEREPGDDPTDKEAP
jgi:hypothetical protein